MEQIVNKKGQGGLVTGLVVGVAGLVIAIIIAFTIQQTLTSTNIFTDSSVTVTNESADSALVTVAWLNATNYSLYYSISNTSNTDFDITGIWGTTGANITYNVSLSSGYWTEYSDGKVVAANTTTFPNVSISYTYNTKGDEELAQDRLTANFTEGIDNVSEHIPTVLLIAAIVLVLGILAVLVGIWMRFKYGGGGQL